MTITAGQLRQKYIDFFVKRGHKQIPPAPLVLENDPTTLFTSSGMQPLVPYLLGQPHPFGKRLVDSQPSLRLEDIGEVGDNRHTTFFEMLGNWSLGDYFKKEQLSWFFEFLTKELGLPKEKLWVSVFEGDASVPKDAESIEIWKKLGIPEDRIVFYGVKKNWWSRSGPPEGMPPGEIGGPDSEVFYDFGAGLKFHENSKYKDKNCHPNCDCGRFLEIGNSVFIQYQKQADGSLKELPQKNVDFGGGLERLVAAVNNNPDIFQIDVFAGARKVLGEIDTTVSAAASQFATRIILDHIRASAFVISSGVEPSNKERGYILRRLIRRTALYTKIANINLVSSLPLVLDEFGKVYASSYSQIERDKGKINSVISGEVEKFDKTLEAGMKLISSRPAGGIISGEELFDYYQTYGYPPELVKELATGKGIKVEMEGFEEAKAAHQEQSRSASAGMFKGGLADHSEVVTKYHSATHLLQAALRQVLGEHVHQEGSNITAERLRFDFSHPTKLTDDEIKKVEDLVNQKIKENLPQKVETMPYDEAIKSGALAFFKERYPEKVTVYSFGPSTGSGQAFSREICGGPHVESTGKIGQIKIIKAEKIAAGTQRVYAKLSS